MPNQTIKRRAAKFFARHAVWTGTTFISNVVVQSVVDVEEDSIQEDVIYLSTWTLGFMTMLKCEKYTDQMVDRVADWRIARKAEKAEHPAE